MRVDRCNNIGDFRSMARRRLPGPIFHYIDGAADDEVTYRRNTAAYERCDLVPNVLAGVESIDMSITVMGQKIDMPLFCAPQLKNYVKEGSNISVSVGDYFSTLLDQSMNWQDAADVRKKWGKQFCLKGIMSIADAKRAVDIGATAIMVSNHGGRQLDGSRSPFDQLAEIVDAVGDRIDVICDGGITRGTHVLKALSVGAKACSGGRLYLYALAAAGQAGVERALENLRAEIERDMKLMGCRSVDQLSRDNLRFR